MAKVRDSSGVLVIVLGSVMAVMALVGLFGGDPGSLALFLPLAAAAFGADLVLRRRSGRPAAADLYVVGAIFAIFALLFGYNRDWRLVAACAAIALTGRSGTPLLPLIALVLVAGIGVVGAQPAINTVAASLYPTALRATGIGWMLGVGRIGGIVGPLAAAELIALQWSNQALFLAAAAPAALSAILVCLLGLVVSRRRS